MSVPMKEGARYDNMDVNLYSNENLIFLSIIVGIYLHDVNSIQIILCLSVCRSLQSVLVVSIKSVIDELSKFCVTKLIPVFVIDTSRPIDRFNSISYYLFGTTGPNGPGPPHSRGFRSHKTTVSRTPLDE